MLAIENRPCLVVGGGPVGLRKVEGLLAEGARVTVVSPEALLPLHHLQESGAITLHLRPYASGEAAAYWLIFTATNAADVNQRVFDDAEAAGRWCNCADEQERCNFHLPARITRGDLHVAIASNGSAPFAVRGLRRLFERKLGPDWGMWIAAASAFRAELRTRVEAPMAREWAFEHFFAESVDEERCAVRVPTRRELDGWLEHATALASGLSTGVHRLQESAPSGASSSPLASLASSGPAGLGTPHCDRFEAQAPSGEAQVSLVGAGPGDGGLLTLKGRQRLLHADAVVLDRLAAPALPLDLDPQIELHWVGKSKGHHVVAQNEINSLLVSLALEGKRVVRLKGGDSFIFGRGGEEVSALQDAGISFEIIPGIPSSVAATSCAGIALTDRRSSSRIELFTAHSPEAIEAQKGRWEAFARDPHGTLVGHMAILHLDSTVANLLAAGVDPATPSALIERGGCANQRRLTAPLAEIAERGRSANIKPPTLLIVGPTAAEDQIFDWASTRPLHGERWVAFELDELTRDHYERLGVELLSSPLSVTPAALLVWRLAPVTGVFLSTPDQVVIFEAERSGLSLKRDWVAVCSTAATARKARGFGWGRVYETDGQVGSRRHSDLRSLATQRHSSNATTPLGLDSL